MHRIPLIALLAVATPAVAQYDKLLWSDEFNGTTLDSSKWTPMIGDGSSYGIPGWGNNELQYYTADPSNVFVDGGHLHIVARNPGPGQYTSARLRSLNKGDFLYGRLEARIQLPQSGPGLWPAFWMLPTGSPYGGWAAGGEIDIMETINNMATAHGTLHFGGQWPENTSAGGDITPGGGSITGFHVYAIEWDPDQIRWYFDGQHYYTLNSNNWFSQSAPSDAEAPFDWPFHFLLNIAVGGNWPGDPNGSTPFPAEMLVDYVRVWVPELPGPYTDHSIPGRMEAEDFDYGGAGRGYWDSDIGNTGNQYRVDQNVDIELASEGGYNVGWIRQFEWLQYTTATACPGEYIMRARVASNAGGGSFRLEFAGANISGSIPVPNTGGWQTWETIEATVTIGAGTDQPLRLVNEGNNSQQFNLNWIEFERVNPADVNGNGLVTFTDLTALLAAWNTPDPCADVDGDGSVGFSDLIFLLSSWS